MIETLKGWEHALSYCSKAELEYSTESYVIATPDVPGFHSDIGPKDSGFLTKCSDLKISSCWRRA